MTTTIEATDGVPVEQDDSPAIVRSTLRVRVGQEDVHYGGNLAPGAYCLKLFGDAITEIAVVTDGDEGLFVGYETIQFLAPVRAGDFLEIEAVLTRRGTTSRTVTFVARKVIASRYDVSESAADVLAEPVVVVRAVGTTVIPRESSRVVVS